MVLTVKITGYSGMTVAPTVVVPGQAPTSVPTEPQTGKKPDLRLVEPAE